MFRAAILALDPAGEGAYQRAAAAAEGDFVGEC